MKVLPQCMGKIFCLFISISVNQIKTRRKAYLGFTLSLMLTFLEIFHLIFEVLLYYHSYYISFKETGDKGNR